MGVTPDWIADAVVYAILPDRFARSPRDVAAGWNAAAFDAWDAPPRHGAYKGGSLRGVVDRLPYLASLGVDTLYLTPVFPSTTHHRYKPVAFDRIEPLLGGDAAFDELLAATRAAGMRLVLDGVFNHVGLGFPPFMDVLEYGDRSPWRDWFHVEHWPFAPFDETRPAGYRCWSGHRTMPVLNHANPAVRRFVIDAAERWVRRGIAGWRLDAASEVEDHGLWRELRERLVRTDPEAYLVGEVWTDATRWLDGRQWHGATNYPLLGALRRFVGGPALAREHLHPGSDGERPLDAAEFAQALETLHRRAGAAAPFSQLNFLSTHDVARFRSVVGGDPRRAVLGAVYLFTLPGAPCIYYGDELGLEGGLTPDNRRAMPEAANGDAAILAAYRSLVRLRKAEPSLRRGGTATMLARGTVHVFRRRLAGAADVLVAVNAGTAPAEARVPGAPAAATRLWATDPPAGVEWSAVDGLRIVLPGLSAILLRMQDNTGFAGEGREGA